MLSNFLSHFLWWRIPIWVRESPYKCDSFASQLVIIYIDFNRTPLTIHKRPLATLWQSFMIDDHFYSVPVSNFLPVTVYHLVRSRHVSVHWQQGKRQLWAIYFMGYRVASNPCPLCSSLHLSPPTALASVLTIPPWPSETDWYQLMGAHIR